MPEASIISKIESAASKCETVKELSAIEKVR